MIEVVVTFEERLSVILVLSVYLISLVIAGIYARRVLGKTRIDRFVKEFYVCW